MIRMNFGQLQSRGPLTQQLKFPIDDVRSIRFSVLKFKIKPKRSKIHRTIDSYQSFMFLRYHSTVFQGLPLLQCPAEIQRILYHLNVRMRM